MSYTSINTFPEGTTITSVKNLVELLGYIKCADVLSIPEQVGCYSWVADFPDISFVGIELSIYRSNNAVSVETRTRAGRSYWDIKQQNITIKYLHDYLGGSFETDEGKNKYLYRDAVEPSRLASGLYLSRWIFNNALITPRIYMNCRTLQGDVAKEKPTGLDWMDKINPRFFSNSIIIPYILGAWEEYFRSSFVVLLQYADCKIKAYKLMRVRAEDFVNVLKLGKRLENQLADSLSFQRPDVIDANFRAINEKLDIAGSLRKPYKRRKKTLFDYIDDIVEERNLLVHTAKNNMLITDKELAKMITDFEAAADKIYALFGDVYGFTPNKDF